MFKKNLNNIYFSFMECGYWCSWVCLNMFIIFYLKGKGVTGSNIGMLLTSGIIFGTIGQYFWGHMCDKFKTIKKNIIICTIALNIVVFILPLSQDFSFIVLIYSIFIFFQATLPSLIDSWVLEYNEKTRQDYSKIRCTASAAFAILSLFFGSFVEKYGYNAMAIGFVFFNSWILVAAILQEDIPQIKEVKTKIKGLNNLLSNMKFSILLISVIFVFISNNFILNFMPFIVDNVGGSAKEIGFVFFVGAASEVPFFLGFNKIKSIFSLEKILTASSIFFLIKISTLLFIQTKYGLYINALIQGLSFTLFYCAVRIYVQDIVPADVRITAQSIISAAMTGIAYLIASSTAGFMLDKYSITIIYIVFSITSAAGVFGIILLNRSKEKTKSIDQKLVA